MLFNGDLSAWQTGKVSSMSSMFQEADAFNRDVSKWNIERVTHMNSSTFHTHSSSAPFFFSFTFFLTHIFFLIFRIPRWRLYSHIYSIAVFEGADAFNGDISKWNPRRVEMAFSGKFSHFVFEPSRRRHMCTVTNYFNSCALHWIVSVPWSRQLYAGNVWA